METPAGRFERFLYMLFCLGAGILGLITLLILYDVIARNIGIEGFAHTLALTEYGLYYTALLGSPWLVRHKHHIYMQLLTAAVPESFRIYVARFAYLVCTLVCFLIAWYSAQVTLETFLRGDTEVRSFDMPRWLIFAIMPFCFSLLTVEFGRYLIGRDSMYDGEVGLHE